MTTTERPLTARRQATQQRLLAAARSVVAERGIPGASLEEICDRAGFTRGAFYSNYSSKNDLVVALVDDLTSRRKAATGADEARTRPATFEDAVRQGIEAFFGDPAQLDEDVILVAELQLWAARNPGARPVHAAMVDDTLDFVGRSFDAIAHLYGATYRIDRDASVRTLHAAFDYYRLRAVLGAHDRAEAKERLVELMLLLFDVPEQA